MGLTRQHLAGDTWVAASTAEGCGPEGGGLGSGAMEDDGEALIAPDDL